MTEGQNLETRNAHNILHDAPEALQWEPGDQKSPPGEHLTCISGQVHATVGMPTGTRICKQGASEEGRGSPAVRAQAP